MSRVTTITLPDRVHRALVRAGRRRGESMAAIVRRALGRELAQVELSETAKRGVPKTLPRDVRVWLRSPPGSFAHLALVRDQSHEPTDWDADATDAGLDAD